MDLNLFESRASILFTKVPMSPSSNNQYTLVRRGGRTFHVPSLELKTYQKNMIKYPLTCPELFMVGKQKIKDWLAHGLPLEIRAIFFFKREKIFTKAGKAKKLDVSNRIKALHDCLCELLEMDDSMFFRVYVEKAECHPNLEEMVCVEILPCR
jgi:Holliday junction resolvase RusA-like endonuclease